MFDATKTAMEDRIAKANNLHAEEKQQRQTWIAKF